MTPAKRFLVLQHAAVEHPGVFRDCMQADGIAWDTVELDAGEPIPALERYDALIAMGGPMDVWEEAAHPWLVAEKAAIRHAVLERRMPYLGVCLGHQLLADALGGRVARAAEAEVGVMDVALTAEGSMHAFFAELPSVLRCLQWHAAEVQAVPPGGCVLAASTACAVQALAVGPRALGIQFHVEVTATTIDDWYAIPAYRDALHRALGADGVDRFRADVTRQLPAFEALARRLWRNWTTTAFA